MKHFATGLRMFTAFVLTMAIAVVSAQTTTTYTFNPGNPAEAAGGPYYEFNVPLVDPSGNQTSIKIDEQNNAYTGYPLATLQFASGPLAGVTFNGVCPEPKTVGTSCWTYSPRTAHIGYPYGDPFPPVCSPTTSCDVLTGEFEGTDPGTGNAVTIKFDFNAYWYTATGNRTVVTRVEIYAGTVTVTE